MRAFVAIFPPPELRAAVTETFETVQCFNYKVRWVRPENIHLTLKFLGNIQEETLGNLWIALEETCARHEPFDISLARPEAFPSAQRARILWAGIDEGSDQLRALAADLESALIPLGFEREKRAFTPHLTLGRVRSRLTNINDLPSAIIGDLRFRVRHIELTESTLSLEGVTYRTILAFALKERG
ncbi:MAG: RNA 2',3'-cyclic phosphodiesterase [Rubrobacter sp.]|nr:RNA 2',3'-cyclic phosphodiesterase [Rubrobacter sp.]